MIAEPLARSGEEGAKTPPRVVIFPNSKVLSSSRGVPAPAADPTSRNRGHDRSSARPESALRCHQPDMLSGALVTPILKFKPAPRRSALLLGHIAHSGRAADEHDLV